MRRLLFTVCLLLIPCAGFAQDRSKSNGFRLSGHFNGTSLKVEDSDDIESGGGIGLAVAYGFSPKFAIFLRGDVAELDAVGSNPNYTLGHGDLGVRYSFASPTRRWIPFLEASFTVRVATYEDLENDEDLELTGAGGSIGGGLAFYISRKFALEGALLFSGGKFDKATLDDVTEDIEPFSATSTRFNIGISWFPGS